MSSEELRYCLDRKGCTTCKNFEQGSVLTCRGLLQKVYEKLKEYEELEKQGFKKEKGENMDKNIAEIILCFSVLYLLDGIRKISDKKASNSYKASHIVYPLFMVGGMFYFIVTGVIK